MSDLNDWELVVGSVVTPFGTATTNYPFETQVEVSSIDREVQDSSHPTSDGLIMGRDRLRGFSLQFGCKILSEYPVTTKPWMSALDLYRDFARQWRADGIRLQPGEYATLRNTERAVQVYGRPRSIATKNTMLRKGVLGFQMDFQTIGPDWFDTTERSSIITPAASSARGFTGPLTAPMVTTTVDTEVGPTINDGDLDAWPVIDFHGPSSSASLELFLGTAILWKISIPSSLKYDQILTVDTRPWRRSATINGKPANGMVRGTQLEKCIIPPGSFSARFRSSDRSGQAFAAIQWRDTYAGL